MALAKKPYFHYSEKAVFTKLDKSVDWNNTALTTPISRSADGMVRPFADGQEFLGILSAKNIKNTDLENADNSIETCYLKGGYIFDCSAAETLADGDYVVPAANGFKKTTVKAEAVGRIVFGGAAGTIVKIRGGNY